MKMVHFLKVNNMKYTIQVFCAVLLVVVVGGDVATLSYGYRYSALVEDDLFTAQLLCGGMVLISVLLLPIIACIFPVDASKLSQLWFAVHVTWSDDWARHAVVLLYNFQVQPVIDALELTSVVANVKDADYWWWFGQGFLLTTLVHCLVNFDENDVTEGVQEMTEVAVDDHHLSVPEVRVVLPDPQDVSSAVIISLEDSTTITIEEIE